MNPGCRERSPSLCFLTCCLFVPSPSRPNDVQLQEQVVPLLNTKTETCLIEGLSGIFKPRHGGWGPLCFSSCRSTRGNWTWSSWTTAMPSHGALTLMPVTLVPHACCLSLPSGIRIIALRELSLSFSAFRLELNI